MTKYTRTRNIVHANTTSPSTLKRVELKLGYTPYVGYWQDHFVYNISKGSGRHFETQTMSDVETPGFKRKSKEGCIINSPMTSSREILRDIPVTLDSLYYYHHYSGFKRGNHYTGEISASVAVGFNGSLDSFSVPMDDSIDVEDVKAIAVSKAHSNIGLQETAALVTLGEGKETVKFLTNTVRHAVRIFYAIRRLNFKYLRKQISRKELEKRYMEYRYALRPLANDVQTTAQAFKADVKNHTRQTFRGFAQRSVSNNPKTSTVSWDYVKFDKTLKAERSVKARAGVLCAIEHVNELALWGLDRPFEAVWDLIPFSFIADWFFNIGSVIGSFTPNYGIRDLASWVVIEEKTRYEWKVSNIRAPSLPAYYTTISTGGSGGILSREIVRKTRVVGPKRSFIPRLDVNLDGLKLLDLSIIAKSLASGFKRLRI